MAYNISPTPYGQNNAFPGQLDLPDPATDLYSRLPGLPGLNENLTSALTAWSQGKLSPGTMNLLNTFEAENAVKSGMPGTSRVGGTFQGNRSARDLGLMGENLAKQAFDLYNPFVSTVSQTQTVSPEMQAEIAAQNRDAATMEGQAKLSESLYDKYLAAMKEAAKIGQPTGGSMLVGGLPGSGGGTGGWGQSTYTGGSDWTSTYDPSQFSIHAGRPAIAFDSGSYDYGFGGF